MLLRGVRVDTRVHRHRRAVYWAVVRHWLAAHWEWGPQLPSGGSR